MEALAAATSQDDVDDLVQSYMGGDPAAKRLVQQFISAKGQVGNAALCVFALQTFDGQHSQSELQTQAGSNSIAGADYTWACSWRGLCWLEWQGKLSLRCYCHIPLPAPLYRGPSFSCQSVCLHCLQHAFKGFSVPVLCCCHSDVVIWMQPSLAPAGAPACSRFPPDSTYSCPQGQRQGRCWPDCPRGSAGKEGGQLPGLWQNL